MDSAGQSSDTGPAVHPYEEPPRQWAGALPVGNGRLGEMVFARMPEERI